MKICVFRLNTCCITVLSCIFRWTLWPLDVYVTHSSEASPSFKSFSTLSTCPPILHSPICTGYYLLRLNVIVMEINYWPSLIHYPFIPLPVHFSLKLSAHQYARWTVQLLKCHTVMDKYLKWLAWKKRVGMTPQKYLVEEKLRKQPFGKCLSLPLDKRQKLLLLHCE